MDQGLTNLTKDIILPINTILILPSFLVTIFHAEKLQSAPNREDMKIICKVSPLTLVEASLGHSYIIQASSIDILCIYLYVYIEIGVTAITLMEYVLLHTLFTTHFITTAVNC